MKTVKLAGTLDTNRRLGQWLLMSRTLAQHRIEPERKECRNHRKKDYVEHPTSDTLRFQHRAQRAMFQMGAAVVTKMVEWGRR